MDDLTTLQFAASVGMSGHRVKDWANIGVLETGYASSRGRKGRKPDV